MNIPKFKKEVDRASRHLLAEKPQPCGKQIKMIRKMLREGMPPANIPFDSKTVDKIFGKLPAEERFKIATKVQQAQVEVSVSEEDGNALINAVLMKAQDKVRARRL